MRINLGSGQRRFKNPWINCDLISRPPDQVPDVVCNGEQLPFPNSSIEMIVIHHCIEHFGCGEADAMLSECHRVLERGGSLVITLPDIKKLAQRWLTHQIDDFIYIVNLMGAYQGEESDRHKWHYTKESLLETLNSIGEWKAVAHFNWRHIEGADIARAWWVLAVEAFK